MNRPKTGAQVIGCVQVKGGAGRSTLATNLAGELSKVGRTVLIDCDMPQGTSSSWVALRQETDRTAVEGDTAADHRELVDKVQAWRDQVEFVVLDGPPRIAELTKAILLLADLTLVPVGASLPELWATTDVLTLIDQASKVRQVNARIVWTRYRPRTKLAQALTEQATELRLPILKSAMGLRIAYVEALGAGLTGAEMADATTRTELKALVTEIRRIIR
jgi:chromosome partitioning protein